MKYARTITLIILGMFALFSCGSDDENNRLSGRFAGTQNFGIGQVTSPFILDLVQNENSITGAVTPPFSTQMTSISNASVSGSTLQFDRADGNITYRYVATVQESGSEISNINGSFGPLGCFQPSSGEPCPADLDGSFTSSKQ